MMFRKIGFVVVVMSVAQSVYPCVASKRAPGEMVFYSSIYLDVSGLPSQFHDELTKAVGAWNGCNHNGGSDFPGLQFHDADTRTIRFHYQVGFSADNPARCGDLLGLDVTIYEHARNEFGEVVPCTRTDVLEDVFAHELGHVYSLNDSEECSSHIMSGVGWRNGNYTQKSLQPDECAMVDDTYKTEEEERQELCAEDDTLSICETAPECEVRGTQGCSPIILDFAADGFDLTGFDVPVNFDINADGLLETVGWTSGNSRRDDGFLVFDRNENGEVDDGSELFGDATPMGDATAPHGYEALFALDQLGNGNGWIDAGDPVYRKLRVWFDGNHNGISEPNELHSLAGLGVIGIEVEPYALGTEHDEHGNYPRYLGRAIVRRNGEEVLIPTADIYFVVAP